MSYSFSTQSASKAAAVSAVRGELLKVVVADPGHAVDCLQAQAAAESLIAVVGHG